MDRRQFTTSIAAGCWAVASGSISAEEKVKQEWGNLTAQFIYDGNWPVPKPIVIPGPPPAGLKLPVLDRSLVLDPMNKGIANVVTWLYLAPGAKAPDVHPDDKPNTASVQTAFRDFQLQPRITLCRVNQVSQVENPEPIDHVFKGDFFKNGAFAVLIPSGGIVHRKFTDREIIPMPVSSGMHPWIKGFMLIRDNPFMAVTNDQGKLTIKNLPVGSHTFTFWHEVAGFITKVKRKDEAETWKVGRLTVDIKPGDNDLGEIFCQPDSKK